VNLQRIGNPGGFRRPAHSVSMDDNETAAVFLERGQRPGNIRGWWRSRHDLYPRHSRSR
jgi:hypothetical protein